MLLGGEKADYERRRTLAARWGRVNRSSDPDATFFLLGFPSIALR
jgi:hypothetical protein